MVHLHFLDQSHLFLVFQLGPFSELEVLDLHLSHATHLHVYLLVKPLLLLEEVQVFTLGFLGELLSSLEPLLEGLQLVLELFVSNFEFFSSVEFTDH